MNPQVDYESKYQAKERSKAVTTVYLILVKGNSILISLRQNTGYQDGNWELPAGHIEGDELLTAALCRETKEELGIVVRPADLKFRHVSYRPAHDKTGNRIDLYYEVDRWEGRVCIGEPEKCAEQKWVHWDSLPENFVPHQRVALHHWTMNVLFDELGIDWLKANGLYML